MTKSEAATLTALVADLWPSRFHWTPAMTGLWAERLARPEWDARQCEAVIRETRATDEGHKPSMSRVLRRCHEVHAPAKPRQGTSQYEPLTAEKWAEIEHDRDAAVRWWAELTEPQRATVIARASEAMPGFAGRWRRFADPKFKPERKAVLMLKAAHRLWGEGFRGPKGGTLEVQIVGEAA